MIDIEKIRLIAERVMGWTVYTDAEWIEAEETFTGDVEKIWLITDLGLMCVADEVSDYFDPFHNIAQAIEAIECYRLSWGPDDLAWVDDEYPRCVWFELTSPAEQAVAQAKWRALIYADDEYCAFADTAATALCEALLRAIHND